MLNQCPGQKDLSSHSVLLRAEGERREAGGAGPKEVQAKCLNTVLIQGGRDFPSPRNGLLG